MASAHRRHNESHQIIVHQWLIALGVALAVQHQNTANGNAKDGHFGQRHRLMGGEAVENQIDGHKQCTAANAAAAGQQRAQPHHDGRHQQAVREERTRLHATQRAAARQALRVAVLERHTGAGAVGASAPAAAVVTVCTVETRVEARASLGCSVTLSNNTKKRSYPPCAAGDAVVPGRGTVTGSTGV